MSKKFSPCSNQGLRKKPVSSFFVLHFLEHLADQLSVGCRGHWVEADQSLPGGNGAGLILKVVEQNNPLIEPGGFVIGVCLNGPVEGCDGLLRISCPSVHDPEIGEHIGIVRSQSQRLVVGVDRLVRLVGIKLQMAKGGPSLDVCGVFLHLKFKLQ